MQYVGSKNRISKEVKVNISNQGDIKQNKRVEKLFKVKGDK